MLPVKIPVTPSISLLVHEFPERGNDINPILGKIVRVLNEIRKCWHCSSSNQGE